jgi:hyperosmotically inducible periplasmic protein
MKRPILIVAIVTLLGGAVCSAMAAPSNYFPASDSSTPDNSARNARDRDSHHVLPTDQSNKPEDLGLTRRVRQAVENDNHLSVEAKNIKIIAVDGVVWLRGPVKNHQEKLEIARTAHQIAGARNVRDELDVSHGQ